MTELNDVALKFGTDSEEYKRAAMYFGFVSKIVTKAKKISFASYNTTSSDVAPSIVGGVPTTTDVDDYKLITNGVIRGRVGSADYQTAPIDLSTGVTSLDDVATCLLYTSPSPRD